MHEMHFMQRCAPLILQQIMPVVYFKVRAEQVVHFILMLRKVTRHTLYVLLQDKKSR